MNSVMVSLKPVFCVVLVASIVCFDVLDAQDSNLCEYEPSSARQTQWQTNVQGSIVRREWGYTKDICSTMNECFNTTLPNDVTLEPQLLPLQTQPSVRVEFSASRETDVEFTLHPFKVDEDGFRRCDMSNGTDILDYVFGDVIVVPDQLLTLGPNYFIANTSDPLTRCEFGLRLNVTIKPHSCLGPGDIKGFCSERGHCVSAPLDEEFHCECCRGYTGKFCFEEDGCADKPCMNGGTCLDLTTAGSDNKFACTCPIGYHGDLCEIEVDNLCTHTPCANNGTCIGTSTEYECICSHGYTGHHCEVNLNDCQAGPCKHGVCVDKLGGYQCYCQPGYGGHNCDREYNECEIINPCQNGGFCIMRDGEHECHCTQGYTGEECAIKVDLCKPTPCHNATECIDFGHTYKCVCYAGFIGTHCEVDINECESNPCQNGGKCYDGINGYSCMCLPSVSGLHCEYARQKLPRKEDVDKEKDTGTPHSKGEHLMVVAATLGGALLIALLVLAFCYCRVHQTYLKIIPSKARSGYVRHRSESDSTNDPRRIPPESIMGASNKGYSSDSSNNRSLASSLKPRRV